jgi:hypothetical protein
MTEPDTVAELDAELALIKQLPYRVPIHQLARRARDELVAWRKAPTLTARHRVRALALEEAARVCEREGKKQSLKAVGEEDVDADYEIACARCAAAIRALKDKGSRHRHPTLKDR